jgi:hypothetical protein
MSLVAGLLQPRLFSSKLSKLKATEKYSGSATGIIQNFLLYIYCITERGAAKLRWAVRVRAAWPKSFSMAEKALSSIVLCVSIIPLSSQLGPQGTDSLPLPVRVAKTGKNNLNEEITPLLPTGIGERFSQTILNLRHAALLRPCELP